MKTSLIVLIISTIISFWFYMEMHHSFKDKLVFASSSKPYSSDPLEFDSYIHHYTFTSVFGTLVTASKKGEISAQIAEKWFHEDNAKHWIFKIRNNIKYSNGDIITAEDYVLCLKRLAFKIKSSQSETGLIEFLEDFDEIKDIKNIKSIYSSGNELHIKFSKSMPEAPYRLAFGFYSLVHPSLFNHFDGNWIDVKKTISSSNYEVKRWTENEFILSLRRDITLPDDSRAIQTIEFINLNEIKTSQEIDKVDMAISDKDSLLFNDNFMYLGTNEGFNLSYVECYGWKDQNNHMNNLELRKWLRFKFYESIKTNGLEITTSFFPPKLIGVVENNSDYIAKKPHFTNLTLITHTMKSSPKIIENNDRKSVQEILDLALKHLSNDSEIKLKQVDFSESMDIEKELNLAINGTGIESENFIDTMRFMFNSKHGANLPDLNGKIKKELLKENPNVNFVNQEIWDQAVIWPIRYYSKGHWFKKKSDFSFEELNLKIPSIDFQFVKTK